MKKANVLCMIIVTVMLMGFFRDVHKRKQRFQQNLQIKPIFSR